MAILPRPQCVIIWNCISCIYPDGKVLVAHMRPTWVLSAPGKPHVGPMNLVIRVALKFYQEYLFWKWQTSCASLTRLGMLWPSCNCSTSQDTPVTMATHLYWMRDRSGYASYNYWCHSCLVWWNKVEEYNWNSYQTLVKSYSYIMTNTYEK